jgi:3-methylcrotonyl-CoA carboxylase alpha subunit
MFSKLLIANRGEIACRVISSAKRLGIRTVAVYSDADATSKHVQMADEAYRLGPAPAKESYLKGADIITLAKQCGAQAIHPGYGFLSENEGFAQACADAGLIFIGPPPSAIAAMGGKSAAKALMEKANVPLVPGYHGDNQAPAFLATEASNIGYPVLIKASAGGGGKGMRIVQQASEFDAALASCKREAINAFGDDKVLIERYLTKPRHIEVQVFGDSHGNVVYLFERDCSVQRRHQKVAEEAPAPGMTASRRQAMGEAAVAAAKAVGYVGAGTVEFIAEPDGRFYFMEMNTRLQVEHPVTEMITGQDLVQWQLQVANGEKLPLTQEQLAIHGHSIEVRVYAENPDRGFLPSIGTLVHLATPSAVTFEVAASANGEPAAIRIDSGVSNGDTISPYYDPMIAKLIVWGKDREQAIARMSAALAQFEVVGLSTNIGFLKLLMRCASFATADLDTGLIERERAVLLNVEQALNAQSVAQVLAVQLARERTQAAKDPWSYRSGWRANSNGTRPITVEYQDTTIQAQIEYRGAQYIVHCLNESLALSQLQLASTNPQAPHTLQVSGVCGNGSFSFNAVSQLSARGEQLTVFCSGLERQVFLPSAYHYAPQEEGGGGKLSAPMSGKVIGLAVAAGEKVTKGQTLLVMEAMKMEHTISAPADGQITELLYAAGDQVAEGAQLIGFAATEEK